MDRAPSADQPQASTSAASTSSARHSHERSASKDHDDRPNRPKRRRTGSASMSTEKGASARGDETSSRETSPPVHHRGSTGGFSIASITHSDAGSTIVSETAQGATGSTKSAGGPGAEEDPPDSTADSPHAGVARSSAGRETRPSSSSTSADNTFELRILQQPEIGADAGMERSALNRLPLVPTPVVQVIVRNQAGEEVPDLELPYLFCMCRLLNEDGTSLPPLEEPPSWARAGERINLLLGGLTRNSHQFIDEDGKKKVVFVFEDVSVRQRGCFTLEFRLGEARPESPRLAAVTSDVFEVVPWEEYPGRDADDVLTDLSRRLHEQGIPMYIPPLTLNLPEPPVPTPSSLPFDGSDASLSRRESRVSQPATSAASASPPVPSSSDRRNAGS